MKIFALPSHQEETKTHGVDYARIISPMKHLNGFKGIETTLYDMKEQTTDTKYLLNAAEKNDIIYFNYLANPWGFAHMGAFARHFNTKIVMDLDDAIWELHKDNPSYEAWKKGGQAIKDFTSICNEVDYITCTNEYLKHVVMNNTNKTADKIKVFPNYIDLDTYTYRAPFKNTNQIILTHFGSTTHFFDLDSHEFFMGMERIRKEYPNVIFRSVGAFLPKFREKWGQRYENPYGHGDIYTWIKDYFPKFLSDTDIMVVPLISDIYNQCKSQIKWLEASSAKIPGVWQDIRQYEEVIDGTNGLLAKKDTEWYRGIKSLIDDAEKRKAMGEKAFQDVKNNWTIQQHRQDYADFFERILLDK